MTYELAKELKEAGFPQTAKRIRIPYAGGEHEYVHLAFPNLSELIEACGDGFDCLMRQDGAWVANHSNHSHGSTPEDAVARLWLAINRPKT